MQAFECVIIATTSIVYCVKEIFILYLGKSRQTRQIIRRKFFQRKTVFSSFLFSTFSMNGFELQFSEEKKNIFSLEWVFSRDRSSCNVTNLIASGWWEIVYAQLNGIHVLNFIANKMWHADVVEGVMMLSNEWINFAHKGNHQLNIFSWRYETHSLHFIEFRLLLIFLSYEMNQKCIIYQFKLKHSPPHTILILIEFSYFIYCMMMIMMMIRLFGRYGFKIVAQNGAKPNDSRKSSESVTVAIIRRF